MTNPTAKKIAVCLPYAVSIRDFSHSGTLAALSRLPGLELTIYTLNPNLPEFAAARLAGATIRGFAAYRDSRAERLLKRSYVLFFSDQFAYIRLTLANRPFALGITRVLSALRRALGTPRFLSGMGGLLLWLYRRRRPAAQLEPGLDLLIGTRSLINSLDYGLIAEATAAGIPVLTLAGSWDNFTTKGYFPFPARKTVVWNRKMQDELEQLFQVPASQVVIAGYPRAALLRRSVLPLTPEEYLKTIGITGYRRYILYCASYGELSRTPLAAAPLEYLSARLAYEHLRPHLPADCCFLVRLHPFSGEADRHFFGQLEHCAVYVPGRADVYTERVMNLNDEQHLATQLALAECILSLASTVSLDALCLKRPILNLDFDPQPGIAPEWSIRRFYHFDHFRDLLRATGLPLAASPAAAVDFAVACLNQTYQSPVDYAAFEKLYVPAASDRYPDVVQDVVTQLLYE